MTQQHRTQYTTSPKLWVDLTITVAQRYFTIHARNIVLLSFICLWKSHKKYCSSTW